MYSPKPIPEPFQKKPHSAQITPISLPVAAKEKNAEPPRQSSLSPLAALLFLDIFTKQKDG